MAELLKSYGNREHEVCLNILLVASDVFCENLSDALYNCSKKQSAYKLLIHMCGNVHDVISSHLNPQVDFIVFEIDTCSSECLDKVKKDILETNIAFSLGRMCFVHDNYVKATEVAVNYNDIWELRNKFGVHVLTGNVTNESKCLYLAERILKLVSVVTGVHSGLPYIDWPKKEV